MLWKFTRDLEKFLKLLFKLFHYIWKKKTPSAKEDCVIVCYNKKLQNSGKKSVGVKQQQWKKFENNSI